MKKIMKQLWITFSAVLFFAFSVQMTAAAASQAENAKAAYKAELAKSIISFDGTANVPASILNFYMCDFNNDKIPELYVYSGQAGGLEQYKAYIQNAEVWSYVNGKIVKQRGADIGLDDLHGLTLRKYYPSKGIYVVDGGFKMMSWTKYYRHSQGKSTLLLKVYENGGYPEDEFATVDYYNGNGIRISKVYYNNLLKTYLGNSAAVTLPSNAFFKNTAANRTKVFGTGVSATVPEYQQITNVTNLTKGIKISWKQSANAAGYAVYRRTGANEPWKKIKSISGRTTTSCIDTSVENKNGTTYYYTVRGVIGNVQGGYDKAGKSVVRLRSPGIVEFKNTAAGTVSLRCPVNASRESHIILPPRNTECPPA